MSPPARPEPSKSVTSTRSPPATAASWAAERPVMPAPMTAIRDGDPLIWLFPARLSPPR